MRTRFETTVPRQSGPDFGARGLSASWSTLGPVVLLALRGDVTPDNRDVLITAVDAALSRPLRALAVSAEGVATWSWRGLEVLVHTAGHAADRRIPFAVSGLSKVDLDLVARTWPGVSLAPFSFVEPEAAVRALAARAKPTPALPREEDEQVRDIRRRLDDDRDIEHAMRYLTASRGYSPDEALASLVRSATEQGRDAVDVARDLLTARPPAASR